jgi:prepilin-type N-terminal cleavage/methylation domain-containing protein
MKAANRQSGFSLIETIVSLVILGFVSVTLMSLVLYTAKGYVMVRGTLDTAGKVQVAMDRIRMELENMQSLTSIATGPGANSLTFVDHGGVSRTLDLDPGAATHLRLGGSLLLDEVASFTLAQTCGNQDGYSGGAHEVASVTVAITSTGNIPPYTLSVYPRSIMNCP